MRIFNRRAAVVTLTFAFCAALSLAQVTTSSSSLSFGKEQSVRASIPINPLALAPGATLVSAATGTTILWEWPLQGSLYASVPVGSIKPGDLLMPSTLAVYGCQPSVIYEAPNHPSIIQSMLQGGTNNVGGTICGTTPPIKDFVAVEYGRKKLGIAKPGADLILGVPNVVVITIPADFGAASVLRVDFGTEVSVGGTVTRILDIVAPTSPVVLSVIYPRDYSSSTVSIQAIATTGAFIEPSPMTISISGLMATGATISQSASFNASKPPADQTPPSITVVMNTNVRQVRRGGAVRFAYTVTNTGSTELRSISVWDSHFGEVGQIATLAPGASRVVAFESELSSSTKSHAIASGTDVFSTTASAESNEVAVEVINPAIAAKVWLDPGQSVKIGQQVTLRYVAENVGDVDLGPVQLEDATDGTTFPGVAELKVGQSTSASRTITVRATDKVRQVRASAVVVPDPGGPAVSADNSTTLDIRNPAISVTLNSDKDNVAPGTDITLTSIVRNDGDIDLYNVAVTTNGTQLGSIRELSAHGSTQFLHPPITMTSTATFGTIVTAQDNWQDAHTANAQTTVHVVVPRVSVSIRANGSATKIRVSKGTSVVFEYSVANAGDCDLHDVKVLADGNEIGNIAVLAKGEVRSLPSLTEEIKADVIKSVRAIARDPNNSSISENDKVIVEAEGITDKMGLNIDAAKRLCADIEVYKQKIESLHAEFVAGLAKHAADKTDPCADGRLSTILQQAQTYLKQYVDATAELQKQSAELAKLTVSNPDTDELLDLIQKAFGGVSGKYEGMVDEMKTQWSALACGDPIKKDKMVNVVVSVYDENGNGLAGAAVSCDKAQANTAGGGQVIFSMPLAKGESVSASASFTTGSGYVASASNSAVYQSGDELTLRINLNTSPVQKVTVTGQVVDKNGLALSGAMVSIGGGSSVMTDAGGHYTLVVEAKLGSTVTINAVALDANGKSVGSSTTVAVGSEASITSSPIVITAIELASKPLIKITNLAISPSTKDLKVGESQSFQATATFEDNSTKDVTQEAAWTGGSQSYTASRSGMFKVSAAYMTLMAEATINVACAANEVWDEKLGKCISLDEAIKNTKDDKDPKDLCDDVTVAADYLSIVNVVSELSQIADNLEIQHQAFNKALNDQKSDPCKNHMVAAELAGAERLFMSADPKIDDIKSRATNYIVKIELCPNLTQDKTRITSLLQQTGSHNGRMKVALADMRDRLRTFGCDPNEVSQNGNSISDNTANPNVTSDGGNGAREIPGDGIDNNGNGLIDEGSGGQTNANVLFYVFDSGDAKDDIFSLSVAGRFLGQSPKGGRSEFGMTLSPGSYSAQLRVIEDGSSQGSCCGTYTITIVQNNTVIGSDQGDGVTGSVFTIPFTVREKTFIQNNGSKEIQGIDFDRVVQHEGKRKK